jgi:hypothetical protein
MLSDFLSIITDLDRHQRVPESSSFVSDVSQSENPWESIMSDAKSKGFTVETSAHYIAFTRGDGSWGSFQVNEGGIALAQRFLRGVR